MPPTIYRFNNHEDRYKLELLSCNKLAATQVSCLALSIPSDVHAIVGTAQFSTNIAESVTSFGCFVAKNLFVNFFEYASLLPKVEQGTYAALPGGAEAVP